MKKTYVHQTAVLDTSYYVYVEYVAAWGLLAKRNEARELVGGHSVAYVLYDH